MACYIVADVTYTLLPKRIGRDDYWQPIIPRLIAVGMSCLVGIGKEIYDKWQGEQLSAGDLTVDFSAAILWLILLLLSEEMYKKA